MLGTANVLPKNSTDFNLSFEENRIRVNNLLINGFNRGIPAPIFSDEKSNVNKVELTKRTVNLTFSEDESLGFEEDESSYSYEGIEESLKNRGMIGNVEKEKEAINKKRKEEGLELLPYNPVKRKLNLDVVDINIQETKK